MEPRRHKGRKGAQSWTKYLAESKYLIKLNPCQGENRALTGVSSQPIYLHLQQPPITMLCRKRISFLSMITIFSAAAFAQNNDLDPVTVTASIAPIAVSKTGRNITVIKGEQFNKQPIHSIDELLKYLPGVEIQQRGPMGAQSDIVIRGGTFQQVLVILDGIRLNDPLTGHFSSYIPIAPAEIERIEILKGAASAIYGTEAVGGVINIITKSFAVNHIKQKQFQESTTIGQYGLLNTGFGGLWSDGKNTVGGGLQTNHATGQQQRGIRGYFDLTTASLSYTRKINDTWSIGYRSAYDDRSFAAQNFYTTYTSDTGYEKVKSFWNHFQVAYQKKKSKLSFNAGYKTSDDFYKFSSTVAANHNKASLFQSLLVYEQTIDDKTSITAGGQFLQKNITSNDRGDHHVPQGAAFVLMNKQLGEHFNINPALRYDYSERYGSQLVPQLNVSYKIKALQLRASAGKTIRDADFTERYNNYGQTFVASGSIGNPDLQVEKSFSYEAGADYWLKNNLKFSVGYFKRDQSNLIDYVTTPYANMPRKVNLSPTGTYALATNIAKVSTSGIEAELQYTKKWGEQSIWSSLGLQWVNNASSSGTPSFYVASAAKFLGNFNIQYDYKNASISLNGIYKQRGTQAASAINAVVTNNYFLLNAKASYAFCKKFANIFIEADNAFDKTYSDLLGTPMPGRWLMGGFGLNF